MKRVIWWCELLCGLGLLSVGFLQDCSLTFGRPIISLMLWPTILLCGVMCLYRLVHFRQYWSSRFFWLLVAFCVSFLISTVVNRRFGWYENIRTLILQGFLFFLIYCYRNGSLEEERRKRRIFAGYYLAVCAFLTLLSFAYMMLGWNRIYYPEIASVPLYYTGFYWGRLYGVYWDPNIGAIMCCVSALLAADCFRRTKKTVVRVLMGAIVALDVFYIAFSDSRTGRIALAVGAAVYGVLYVTQSTQRKKAAAAAGIALILTILVPMGIKSCYNSISAAEQGITLETAEEEENVQENGTKMIIRQDGSNMPDVSNRRLDIWKSAIEVFASSPVVGVGHNTLLPYVRAEQPESYLINNDHMEFTSMHNTFLDVLVAQGALGFILYVGLAAGIFLVLVRKQKVILKNTQGESMALTAIAILVVCASVLMSEIVYVASPMSFIFWMGLGCTMQASDEPAAE